MGNGQRDADGATQTGIRCLSASSTASAPAPAASTSAPRIRTGFADASIRLVISAIWSRDGEPAVVTTLEARNSPASPASSVQSSQGMDTYTGPRGAAVAVWMAWAMARGTSEAIDGSRLNFTSGWGNWVASTFESIASRPIIGRACCPAEITSGLCEYQAFAIAPIAFPVPAAEWRFTNVGSPVTRL